MARLFDDGLNEYLALGGTLGLSYPFAVSYWAYTDTYQDQAVVFWANDSNNFEGIFYRNPGDNDIHLASRRLGVTALTPLNQITYTTSTWHHIIGIWASNTDRRLLKDGGNKQTIATSVARPTLTDFYIGRYDTGTIRDWSGGIAEVAIWDLSGWPGATGSDKADEFERFAPSLAGGYSPLMVRRGLVAYWPLGGCLSAADGDRDIVGGYDLTAYSDGAGPGVADHPSVFYPSRPRLSRTTAPGALLRLQQEGLFVGCVP